MGSRTASYDLDLYHPENNYIREFEKQLPEQIMELNESDKYLYEFIKSQKK